MSEAEKGAVRNIQKLSQLGRRRAGTDETPPSSDAALIASIYMNEDSSAAAEAPRPAAAEEVPVNEPTGGHEPPPYSEEPAPVSDTAPGATDVPHAPAASAQEGSAGVRLPPKKAILVALAILVLTAVVLVRSCGSDSGKKPAETKATETETPWVRVESSEIKPLDAVLPGPDAAVGIEREKQIPRMIEGLNKPEKPTTPAATPPPADKPAPENTERTRELEARVASLTQELQALRAEREKTRKAPAAPARAAAPAVKILAVARTEKCLSCPLLALLDVDGKTLQVTSGDKVREYTVAVSADRVVLSRGRESLTFYSLTAP